jgi:pimeloyl-ACP methyl ester carboxylesterase
MTAPLNARETRGAAPAADGEGVVLIHGLGRTPASMWLLDRRLAARGYRVRRVGYPSRRIALAEATAHVRAEVEAHAEICGRVHLVGHSLGGVIARRIAEAPGGVPVGRVVQIGSPNLGSGVAARLSGRQLATRGLGPVLAELALIPRRLARLDFLGAIAGTAHCGLPRGLHGLAGPHDGLVTVRSAWAGAAVRAAVPVIHTLLPASRAVARLVAAWLRDGSFAAAGCGRIAR